MNNDFQRVCELFVTNNDVLTKTFAFSHGIMNMSSSLILTDSKVSADAAKIKDCEKVLKGETGVLSDFRGNIKIPLICKMLISGCSKMYLACVNKAFKLLKEKKMSGNEYKLLAAMIIYDHAAESEYQKYADLTAEIYAKMKKQHSLLTNDEDIPFAAILATSGINPDKLVTDMEACYTLLRKKFRDKNAVQSLSQVLSISSKSPEVKCERVAELFDALKKAGHKFGTGYELATLGTLATMDNPIEELVALIIDADNFLKKKRGFGNFTLGAKHRRLYAAQLAANYLCPRKTKGNEFALGSTLSLTISMQVSMIVCISASTVAATTH